MRRIAVTLAVVVAVVLGLVALVQLPQSSGPSADQRIIDGGLWVIGGATGQPSSLEGCASVSQAGCQQILNGSYAAVAQVMARQVTAFAIAITTPTGN